eukprot:5226178-Ditylum_brightwellii.AAC.1
MKNFDTARANATPQNALNGVSSTNPKLDKLDAKIKNFGTARTNALNGVASTTEIKDDENILRRKRHRPKTKTTPMLQR